MRFVAVISLFLAWVLIASSNPPQTQEAGWTSDAGEVASRALEPSALISCGISHSARRRAQDPSRDAAAGVI
jgi:hypothetical protein